jgi:rhodanese-related sulfurtransferase
MHRRTFLAATATGLAGAAGCLGSTRSAPEDRTTRTPTGTPVDIDGPMDGDDLPEDDDPTDGYPPEFDRVPDERAIDTDAYEQMDSGVVLAPIEDAYYWYARREARFVDARSQSAYEKSHLFGAVSSPVGNVGNGDFEDPVEAFPTEDRIVAYCGCPHHLSSMRAEKLMANGYENVYVIDEGFWEWHDREYPLAGDAVDREPAALALRGRTDPASAGETAWARHRPTGQMEATDVRADGTYEMTLRFHGVSARSHVEVETPDYRVEAPLSELTSGVITGQN